MGLYKDGRSRCFWANPKNERYIRYHDEEWGQPVYDDKKLFEMLILESFQAGLSWECVLNKREAFREAFDGFDLKKVCGYQEEQVERLMQNKEIIRNRRKITAAIKNANILPVTRLFTKREKQHLNLRIRFPRIYIKDECVLWEVQLSILIYRLLG